MPSRSEIWFVKLSDFVLRTSYFVPVNDLCLQDNIINTMLHKDSKLIILLL